LGPGSGPAICRRPADAGWVGLVGMRRFASTRSNCRCGPSAAAQAAPGLSGLPGAGSQRPEGLGWSMADPGRSTGSGAHWTPLGEHERHQGPCGHDQDEDEDGEVERRLEVRGDAQHDDDGREHHRAGPQDPGHGPDHS